LATVSVKASRAKGGLVTPLPPAALRNPPLYVVAIDGSAGSRRALDVAIGLAKSASAMLEVVTVEDYRAVARELKNPREVVRVMRQVHESCDTLVERARQRAQRAGVEGRSRVLDSDEPSAAIAGYAEGRRASLVVVGSRGRSAARKLVLGSVAERVVRMAPCSVVVVR
jgi:nucleotide-binding universal stress UspA family protein